MFWSRPFLSSSRSAFSSITSLISVTVKFFPFTLKEDFLCSSNFCVPAFAGITFLSLVSKMVHQTSMKVFGTLEFLNQICWNTSVLPTKGAMLWSLTLPITFVASFSSMIQNQKSQPFFQYFYPPSLEQKELILEKVQLASTSVSKLFNSYSSV